MSTRAELVRELAASGLTPDSVARLATAARELWSNSPTVAAFTAWGLFRALATRWDDNQAIPSREIAQFRLKLAPKLDEWLRTDATFADAGMIADTVAVLHDCRHRRRVA